MGSQHTYAIENTKSPQAHFDFRIIDNTKYLRDSYALRYDVYCNERNFLVPEIYPSKLESDHFDEHAIHIGAIDRAGVLVGTLRLVLPSTRGLPLFKHCELFNDEPDYASLPHSSTAEISRLAVSRSYRRRTNDALSDLANQEDAVPSTQAEDETMHRRHRSEIILGLYKTMYQVSKRRGITHWFAAMEKTLLRLLHRYSFAFNPIGPQIDYYGPVTPYLTKIAHIETGLRRQCPEMFAKFIQGLELGLVPPICANN
ncbi:MAG: PEP-CTERM/exosortase system-associated acyltransferase [Methylophilaceae bacterium]